MLLELFSPSQGGVLLCVIRWQDIDVMVDWRPVATAYIWQPRSSILAALLWAYISVVYCSSAFFCFISQSLNLCLSFFSAVHSILSFTMYAFILSLATLLSLVSAHSVIVGVYGDTKADLAGFNGMLVMSFDMRVIS